MESFTSIESNLIDSGSNTATSSELDNLYAIHRFRNTPNWDEQWYKCMVLTLLILVLIIGIIIFALKN